MYVVASLWRMLPERREEGRKRGLEMRDFLKSLPGIELMVGFDADDDKAMVVIGYTDEATYNRIVNDPVGPFVKALEEKQLEEYMAWEQSWRGEELV